ncbi:hypothetical protein FS749_012111, partial [Ceratobasidium sp. UAMH 11750]
MADRQVCPCCQRKLSVRQIYRHMELYQEQLAAELAALGADDNLDPKDGGLGMENINMGELAQLADAMEFNDPGPVLDDLGADQGNLGAAQGNLDIDALHAPAQGLRRNPPVIIEDWPEPDNDADNDEDGSESDQSDNIPDDIPEFVERDVQPGLDLIAEPRYTDEE